MIQGERWVKKEIVLRWIESIVMGCLVIIVAMSIFTMIQVKQNPNYIPTFFGYKPLSILSGSMRPSLETGDMIFVKTIDAEKVEKGDVISYWINDDTLITHRVVGIIKQGDGSISYRTRGDANNVEDNQLVGEEQLLGVLAFGIPKGGYAAHFIRSPQGFIIFIIIPTMLLIITEMNNRGFLPRREGQKEST